MCGCKLTKGSNPFLSAELDAVVEVKPEAVLPRVLPPTRQQDEPVAGDVALADRDAKPGNVESAPRAEDECAAAGGGEPVGVIASLAVALERASEAGRWDVVALLARELEARRMASLPNVTPIGRLPARR